MNKTIKAILRAIINFIPDLPHPDLPYTKKEWKRFRKQWKRELITGPR